MLEEASSKEGHCFLPKEDLFARVQEFLRLQNTDLLEPALNRLCERKRLYLETIRRAESVYQSRMAKSEKGLAMEFRERIQALSEDSARLRSLLREYETLQGIGLDETQRAAVLRAVQNRVSVITGGPGTGKTTIIKAVIWVLQHLGTSCRVALCSPTGRAAKRMSESTGRRAATIHRMLGFNPGEGFAYNEFKSLPAEAVICDEASMLDTRFAYALVRALDKKCRLILVGDVNQLPSVGVGNVLNEIIASEKVPVSTLGTIYRQSDSSFIALNAKAVLEGKKSEVKLDNTADDFFFMGVRNQEAGSEEKSKMVQAGLVTCVERLIAKGYGLNEIQVLSPMKDRTLGENELNILLQRTFNPQGRTVYQGNQREFRVGDKVMQVRNNYDRDVFNGDVGTVASGSANSLTVDFYGKEVAYKREDLHELTLAYAITIHKAQGSESRAVILIMSNSHYIMLSRPILYTGITRAKEICTVIGEKKALWTAIGKNEVSNRNTHLAWLIQGKH